MRIHLNIGSNQGDRRAVISRAVALIADAFPEADIAVSSAIESEPWGYDSPNPFINVGVYIINPTAVAPLDVLAATQRIERAIAADSPHRNPDGSYRDRIIDIDIIDIDRTPYSHPSLILPHPRARLRSFVLDPMRQLDPTHPLLQLQMPK